MWWQHAWALAWADKGCQPISVRQVANPAWGLGGVQMGGGCQCALVLAWEGKGLELDPQSRALLTPADGGTWHAGLQICCGRGELARPHPLHAHVVLLETRQHAAHAS